MKIRIDKKANYKAVFFNRKTIRQRLNAALPILTPEFAEIEDVAINNQCFGNCPYCYTSAEGKGKNFDDIIAKAKEIWGSVESNNRPFQIAIGGAGESTLHPQWVDFVRTVYDLGIMPNYTTNGMNLTPRILKATGMYCGGVAVSYHPHLKKYFTSAIGKLIKIKYESNIALNIHLIIGSPESLNETKRLFALYKDKIEYFVMLPYQASGRAKKIETQETFKKLFAWVAKLPKEMQRKFAFGANFYNWLLENKISMEVDMYEPEIYSGYRIFDETYKILRKSSYNLKPKYEKSSYVLHG